MLTNYQREALISLLRQSRPDDAEEITRRDVGMVDPPASFGQEQLWFVDRFAAGRPVYNIPQVLRLSGALDRVALGRALGRLVGRHEALRTRLVAGAGGRPVQVICEPGQWRLEVEDFAGFGPRKRGARLREFVHGEAMRPFDLAAGPLLRTSLVRLGEGEHLLVCVVHHAVFDGWSTGVLVRDLAALYRAEVTGEPAGLAELAVQFADYAVWERDRLRGAVLADLEEYWRQVMAGFGTVQFPADRPRPLIDSFDGALAERMTDAALLAGLRELARREGTTVFAAVLAGLLALLYRYTGQTDLVVGTVSANRSRGSLAPLIGFLVNTLPIRCDVSGDPAFTELLARVKNAVIGAFAHQDLPFGKLVDTLKVERDASRAPVFQIALTYAEPDDTPVPAAGVDFVPTDLIRGINAAKFDLTFAAEARRAGLWLECSYKSALFDPGTIDRLLGHLEVLLRGATADPAAPLSRLPLLTGPELHAELRGWNDTDPETAPVPPGCIHQGFEAQAARTPDAVAAQYEDEQLSYAELDRWADQIARRLRRLGVGPESLVGVCMRTSLRRLAALLGVLKAGAGYVPLDPAAPPERLSFMITDTAMAVILTDEAGAPPTTTATTVTVPDRKIAGHRPGDHVVPDPRSAGPANVAYVIYTSGSTGQPKGVVVEHRNAVNFLHGMISQWRIGPGSAVLQFASYTFDVSVMDMFMPLLAGGRVVLASRETLHSPPRLAALIQHSRITFACLPPAVLGLLPDREYPDLRVLMAAGEELPAHLARRWIRPGLRLVNGYGPTETTVLATFAELHAATPPPPPIGLPVRPNYQAYILDPHLNPVPVGVTGELHLGGAGVARGYHNRPDLTRQRFIPDPFRPGQRLYKTGDLVRRRLDGSIVFTGRTDNQAKIRGLRIEPGEIEAALAAHPAVAQAVVTVVTAPAGEKQLAGYLRPTGPVSVADIRQHLARTLPAYMIPTHLIPLDELPLTAHGKIDKARLPPPDTVDTKAGGSERVPPRTMLEAALADLYATVLGTQEIGVTDGFFDLGGSSLLAMQLVTQLRTVLDADLDVSAVFLTPTPRQLAELLRDKHGFEDGDLDGFLQENPV